MSYLNSMNLLFSGDFLSDVSTVNNDVRHYDNATFEARYQTPEEDTPQGTLANGWWNPTGGALFQFVDCTVQRCILANGQNDTGNALLNLPVTNTAERSGGKMVDLDPQMQMTSELWGVKFRLADASGTLYFEGDILDTGFRDLQTKQFDASGTASASPNGQPSAATFCTVIQNITWGAAASGNAFLTELRSLTDNNQLRLHLTTFGYYYSHADGRFSYGRVIGSVTPWKATQPLKFANTRRVYGTVGSYFGYTNYDINPTDKVVTVDLGMSIPIIGSMGIINPLYTSVTIAVANVPIDLPAGGDQKVIIPDQLFMEIGTENIADPNTWLMSTGGVVSYTVNDTILNQLANHQLLILVEEQGQKVVYGRESRGGWYVRADQNVMRLDPGNQLSADMYVYQWGQPVSGATVNVTLGLPLPGQGGGYGIDQPTAPIPLINKPADKVTVSGLAATDANGKTTVTIAGTDPGNPRGYLDGQIYLFKYGIDGVAALDKYWNDKVIVHLRDEAPLLTNPTWADVEETWLQFGNLYPIMSHHIADFSLPNELLKRKDILIFAFTRQMNDPLYMPVTRDMSQNKIETLINWLNTAQPQEAEEEGRPRRPFGVRDKRKPRFVSNPADLGKDPEADFLNTVTRSKSGEKNDELLKKLAPKIDFKYVQMTKPTD